MEISILNGILSLFLQVLKISILSGAGILLLLAVSPLLLRRHTVFWRYLLWVVLAIRLVLPFDISIPGRLVISVPMGIKAGEQMEKILPEETQSAAEKMLPEEKQSAEKSVPLKEEAAVQAADFKTEAFQEENRGKENIREKNVWPKESLTGEPMAAKAEGIRALYLILQWAAVLWAAGVIALLVWQVICYRNFCCNLEKTKSFLTQKEQLFIRDFSRH